MWPVRFTEAARAELIDAQDWYEAEAPGLGRRFRAEIDSVVGRMAAIRGNSPPFLRLSVELARRNFPTRSFSSLKPMPSWSSPAFIAAATPPLAKARVKRLWVHSLPDAPTAVKWCSPRFADFAVTLQLPSYRLSLSLRSFVS